jgi:hypothetical protein
MTKDLRLESKVGNIVDSLSGTLQLRICRKRAGSH